MKKPIDADALEIAHYKKLCHEYLYDFEMNTGRWEGMGCVLDPRINMTLECNFMHSIELSSCFHTEKQGVGYLRTVEGYHAPYGVECLVRAIDELNLWKRFLRCMKLAFEDYDSYKLYCYRKKYLMHKAQLKYFERDENKKKKINNEQYEELQDLIEEEALAYAEEVGKLAKQI